MSATSKVSEARDIARLNPPAFAVLDLRLEDGSGLDVVEVLHRYRPDARAVILTGYGAIATAVAAVKAGAVDYLAKPADVEDIVRALSIAATACRNLRKTRCRQIACDGSIFSAFTSCVDIMCRRRHGVSTCIGAPCSAFWRNARRDNSGPNSRLTLVSYPEFYRGVSSCSVISRSARMIGRKRRCSIKR